MLAAAHMGTRVCTPTPPHIGPHQRLRIHTRVHVDALCNAPVCEKGLQQLRCSRRQARWRQPPGVCVYVCVCVCVCVRLCVCCVCVYLYLSLSLSLSLCVCLCTCVCELVLSLSLSLSLFHTHKLSLSLSLSPSLSLARSLSCALSLARSLSLSRARSLPTPSRSLSPSLPPSYAPPSLFVCPPPSLAYVRARAFSRQIYLRPISLAPTSQGYVPKP